MVQNRLPAGGPGSSGARGRERGREDETEGGREGGRAAAAAAAWASLPRWEAAVLHLWPWGAEKQVMKALPETGLDQARGPSLRGLCPTPWKGEKVGRSAPIWPDREALGMLNLYLISGSHSCCESVCLRGCSLSVCLSETFQTLLSFQRLKKSAKFAGMCTFIHWILCNSAGLVAVPLSWKGAFLQLTGCRSLGFPPPWAEFPTPGSRVALRFEARQLLVWQGGRGRDQRLWPLNCTSDPYCLSFRHLGFLSLGSKVTANFLATYTSYTDQVTGRLGPWGLQGKSTLSSGAAPPSANSPGWEIAPFAAGDRAGAGGSAGRGVERATFTGPRGFTPAGLEA